jgi:hypothetical protein
MPMLNGQIRAGMGFVGFDIPACLEFLELSGVPRRVAAMLLPFWEQGFTEHFEETRKDGEK